MGELRPVSKTWAGHVKTSVGAFIGRVGMQNHTAMVEQSNQVTDHSIDQVVSSIHAQLDIERQKTDVEEARKRDEAKASALPTPTEAMLEKLTKSIPQQFFAQIDREKKAGLRADAFPTFDVPDAVGGATKTSEPPTPVKRPWYEAPTLTNASGGTQNGQLG